MKTYPLGPRAKANFNTSIARQSLGFVPFESSIIFPALDTPIKEAALDIIVPFVPDNITPARQPEPEYKVIKPIIFTVADSTTHIAAPSAIIEGLSFNLSFIQEPETKKDDKNEEKMMRALMV
ncbi:hypothetical protein BDZ91DRAFT_289523 [Kalaharituber pfeilii]|nr:hypothetical protein BDZ91DRAFT_289523 [Kalaharituber pfeilii]